MVFTTGQLFGMAFMGVLVLGVGIVLAWLDRAQDRFGMFEEPATQPSLKPSPASGPELSEAKSARNRNAGARSRRKHGR